MPDNLAEEAIAYEPDRTLRKLIGETIELAQIFTRERIAAGQQEVSSARAEFFDKAATDVRELEGMLDQNPEIADDSDALFEEVALRTTNIGGPARLFGFGLISAICGHIVDHCEPGAHTPVARYMIMRELIKLLRVAMRERITDEKRTIGRELRISLNKY